MMEKYKENTSDKIAEKMGKILFTFFSYKKYICYTKLFTMLYRGQDLETIIFIIISEGDERLIFILLFV